jgi:hypothetical protein
VTNKTPTPAYEYTLTEDGLPPTDDHVLRVPRHLAEITGITGSTPWMRSGHGPWTPLQTRPA